jgi:ferredoxin-NADP reductase
MTPTGSFGPALDPGRCRRYAAITGGSGITPIRSIVETALEVEADSSFTLVYSNRTFDSTMFREELEELTSRFADRLEILHVTSREKQHDELLSGRLDAGRFARLLAERLPVGEVDEWFVCGPPELVDLTHNALLDADVDPAIVNVELFQGLPSDESRGDAGPAELTFRLGGEEHTLELAGGEPVLEGALGVRDDVPYACMAGACGTCRAKLIDGDVEMDHNYALKRDDLAEGYVLTCQAHPTTDAITVDYDA